VQVLSNGTYLGQNVSQLKLGGIIITKCNYMEGLSSSWHYHKNSYFTFILKGGSIEERRKEKFFCSSGMLLSYFPGEPHRNLDYKINSKNFSIEIEEAWLYKFGFLTLLPKDLSRVNNPIVKNQILNILSEVRAQDKVSAITIETILLNTVSILNSTKCECRKPAWINKLNDLLHDEFNSDWDLRTLSEILSIHPVTISKYFPKYFHTTIGDFIRKIKTEKSLADLSKKSISLQEIACRYGFVDNAHYTRVFKKNTGLTPSEYRQFIAG
jgi:AraC family transcriptional regulator